MNDRVKSVQKLLLEALEIQDGHERSEFLARACGADNGLRMEIEELIRAQEAAGAFLPEEPAPGAAQAALASAVGCMGPEIRSESALNETPGERIGRYKLLQKIGEGGCGVVYMAAQEEPVRRKVALKVIKLGMDTRSVVARFEAERQALALMDHPNIARVLDTGATEAGRPYFVMELVRGRKITTYCDEQRLSMRQRLELFIQVCQAVQHAHQKGVIHRDLKPSNILVTERDGVPVPKVIDFGIAKAFGGVQLTDRTLFTAFEQFIGTPAYMSPEQARFGELDIDTRSDIYSLGVLLYELLTGKTPFETEVLLASGLDGMRQTIREKQPLRPSTRLTMLGNAELTTTASHRGVDPLKLVHLLRGDLDWIIMKCLEKDRVRRYETANGLSFDILRHLNNQPVIARPPSRIYEFRKTVQRHKVGFAATATIILVLAAGTAISTWEAVHARRAERARQTEATRATQEADRARNAEKIATEKTTLAERERDRAEVNLYAADMNLAQRAFEENNLDHALNLLCKHQPSAGAKDLRGWEWRRLWQLCQSDEFFTLGQQVEPISALAQSPDNKWLLIASGAESPDGEVKLWDLAEKRLVNTFASGDSIVSAVFSHDGELVAFGTVKNGVRIWNLNLRREVDSIPINQWPRGGCGLAFSPAGHLLAIGDRAGLITLWDCESRSPRFKLRGHTYSVPSLAFNQDGSRLVSAAWDHTVRLWDTTTGMQVADFGKNACWFQAVTFSPDGQLVAAGDWRGRVHVWQVPDRRRMVLLTNHTAWVSSVAFSPDGKALMSAGADYMMRFCNTSNWAELGTLKGHRDEISAATYSHDGNLIFSGDKSGWIKVWSAAAKPRGPPCMRMPPDWALDQAAIAPDASAVAFMHTNKSFSLLSGSDLHRLGEVTNSEPLIPVADWVLSPGGKRLALLGRAGRVRILDGMTHEERVPIESGSEGDLCGLAFSIDGELLAVGGNRTLSVWNVHNGKLVAKVLRADTNRLTGLTFSRDRSTIAVAGSTGTVEVWEIGKPSTVFWKAHRGEFDTAFVPGEKTLITAGRDANLVLWDISTQTQKRKLGRTSNAFYSVAVTPDGTRIAAGTATGLIELYDPLTGHQLSALTGHTDSLVALAFSPEGRTLVSVARDSMRVWQAPALTELASK